MESLGSTSPLPLSLTKHYLPYFTAEQIEFLNERSRPMSRSQEQKARQQACSFIEAIGSRIGFPRKTIATAQMLYHRFHLFFPRRDFAYQDVAVAALYVSTKLHDTLKKPREILMVSYAVRFPDLAAKSKAIGGEVDMDPATVEQDRQRVIALERIILETMCFNFTLRMAFPYVVKLGRRLSVCKRLTMLAWRIATDCHRTFAPLQYPPHIVALASIYIAALLRSFDSATEPAENGCLASHDLVSMLGKPGTWEQTFKARAVDLQEITHQVLDLLLHVAQMPINTSPTTPNTPTSPSHPTTSRHGSSSLFPSMTPSPSPQSTTLQPPSIPYRADQLTQIKIHLRETEDERLGSGRRNGHRNEQLPHLQGQEKWKNELATEVTGFGRNEGTVRFLFGPGDEVAPTASTSPVHPLRADDKSYLSHQTFGGGTSHDRTNYSSFSGWN